MNAAELGSGNGLNGNKKRAVSRVIVAVIRQIAVLLVAILMLYPILWMIASSLRGSARTLAHFGLRPSLWR